jgi:hypothetical protein
LVKVAKTVRLYAAKTRLSELALGPLVRAYPNVAFLPA